MVIKLLHQTMCTRAKIINDDLINLYLMTSKKSLFRVQDIVIVIVLKSTLTRYNIIISIIVSIATNLVIEIRSI